MSPKTGKVSGTVGIGTDTPMALSVSPVTGNVYAALNVSGQVVEISGTTGKVSATAVLDKKEDVLDGLLSLAPKPGDLLVGEGSAAIQVVTP